MTSLTSPGFRSLGFRDIGAAAGGLQPVPGAIAYYRFDEGRNLLKYSQDFDNAVWLKRSTGVASAPVVTPNVALAPNNTITADRIVFNLNGGTASTDLSQIVGSIITQVVGTTYASSFWVRTESGTVVMQLWTPNGSSKNVTITSEWVRISHAATSLTTDSSSSSRLHLRGGAGTSDSATIYAWGAQLEVGSTPTDYFPTTDKQLLIDYSGNGNHGTLGSTSGVDTNDPAWNEKGLVYGADDYVKFGPIRNAAGVTQNLGSMSMAFYVPGAISAASTKTCSYSIGAGKAIYFGAVSGAPANNIITVQYAVGSYSSWCSATDTIPIGWHTLAVNWNGLAYDIYIDGIPKPVTIAGTPAILSLTDANCCYDGTTFGTSGLIRAERLIYPVGLSYSDLMQDRLTMASDAAQKGIALP